jgi:positive regulator of sigma E activity
MRKPWLPMWLYELLPLVYLLFGVLMFALFGDEPLGTISGLLLFAAGVLVWALRFYTRAKGSPRKQ